MPASNVNICLWLSFPAPDENPSEVKVMGTEHNNLVITWKVNHVYCSATEIRKHVDH